jgi:hypothetical protein
VPEFVVAIDGSHVLNEDDLVLESVLNLLSQMVDDVFVPIATQLANSEHRT